MSKSIKCFPLPEFSYAVQPLLNGDSLSEEERARLSSKLKNELVSFLNQRNLISSGSSSIIRWQYRNLGETLALKYPKMLWDLPSQKSKNNSSKKGAPNYVVFIRRLSQRRKMKRLRGRRKAPGYEPKLDRTRTAPLTIPRLHNYAVPTRLLTPPEPLVKLEVNADQLAYQKREENTLNDETEETDRSQAAKFLQTDSRREPENFTEHTIVIKQELASSDDEWPPQVIDSIISAEELVPSTTIVPSSSNLPTFSCSLTSNRTPFVINSSPPESALYLADPDSMSVDAMPVTSKPQRKRKIGNVNSNANDSTSTADIIKSRRLEKSSTRSEGGNRSHPSSGTKKSAGRTIPSSEKTQNAAWEMFETMMNSSEDNPVFRSRTRKRPGDLFDVFADFIAEKLREMTWNNCTFALRTILDTVFKAGQAQQNSEDEDSDSSVPGCTSDQE